MFVVGGDFAGRHPVDEAPPGELAKKAVGVFVFGEPGENVACSGEFVADELGVGAIHPVVVEHADPEQGERSECSAEDCWDSGCG